MTMTARSPDETDLHTAEEGRLIVSGRDRVGIVAAVSTILAHVGANIVALDQHSTDPAGGRFFQRTVFRLPDLAVIRPELESALDHTLKKGLDMEWRLVEAATPKRAAIFVSKPDHCVLDLLWRQRRGELNVTIEMVISNHADLAEVVRSFGIPYFHVPVTAEHKKAAEERQLSILAGEVDFVVLARYMQILSGDFLRDVGVPIINIHHSFLPAFVGADPYRKAKERGVKLVGASAHYVTEELDEGPIIEQDVVRVSHADTAGELMRRGADVERLVLARAVAWHAEDRVLSAGNSTIVFTP